jgi:hypothetical protein
VDLYNYVSHLAFTSDLEEREWNHLCDLPLILTCFRSLLGSQSKVSRCTFSSLLSWGTRSTFRRFSHLRSCTFLGPRLLRLSGRVFRGSFDSIVSQLRSDASQAISWGVPGRSCSTSQSSPNPSYIGNRSTRRSLTGAALASVEGRL